MHCDTYKTKTSKKIEENIQMCAPVNSRTQRQLPKQDYELSIYANKLNFQREETNGEAVCGGDADDDGVHLQRKIHLYKIHKDEKENIFNAVQTEHFPLCTGTCLFYTNTKYIFIYVGI